MKLLTVNPFPAPGIPSVRPSGPSILAGAVGGAPGTARTHPVVRRRDRQSEKVGVLLRAGLPNRPNRAPSGHSHAMADVPPIRTASAVDHELSLSDGGAEAAVRSSWIVKTILLAVVHAREAFLVHLDMPCTMTRWQRQRVRKVRRGPLRCTSMTAVSILVDAYVKFEENSSTDQQSNLSHGLGDDKT